MHYFNQNNKYVITFSIISEKYNDEFLVDFKLNNIKIMKIKGLQKLEEKFNNITFVEKNNITKKINIYKNIQTHNEIHKDRLGDRLDELFMYNTVVFYKQQNDVIINKLKNIPFLDSFKTKKDFNEKYGIDDPHYNQLVYNEYENFFYFNNRQITLKQLFDLQDFLNEYEVDYVMLTDNAITFPKTDYYNFLFNQL